MIGRWFGFGPRRRKTPRRYRRSTRRWCEHTAISFETAPPSVAGDSPPGSRPLEPKLPWLVAERDGCVAGYAYAARHHERGAYRWSVDTSVYVAETARGAGVGRTLYGRLLPLLTGCTTRPHTPG